MDLGAPISSIMSREVVCATTHMVFSEVKDLFTKHNIHHIPVVHENKLIGILSFSDMLREGLSDSKSREDQAIQDVFDAAISIEAIMSKQVITVQPEDSIRKVVELFVQHSIHALPIVDKEELIGIVTPTDFLRALLEQG